VLGGNIGIPLVERLPELTPEHRVVVELSELQLPSLSRGTDIAVFTHVTSDHLDRHGTVEAYRAAKRRLAELARPNGRLVLNAEDPVSSAFAKASSASSLFYRRDEPLPGGVGVRGDWIVANDVERLAAIGGGTAGTGPNGRIMPLGEVQIPGDHNTSNVLAAVAVGLLFGIAPDAIRQAVGQFRGVEHRLEYVATIDGVTFVNDSQGTQPDAVIAALNAFEPPIVLICGGRTKNVPLDELAAVVAQRADAAVLIGETADEMAALFGSAGLRHVEFASDLDDAVARAVAIARDEAQAQASDGATVLLSPAATSFDMFVDYEHRGRAFKEAVLRLAESRGAGK
jgi:UDP-N-acetylmuramoylalanine--D-glutamate ligase